MSIVVVDVSDECQLCCNAMDSNGYVTKCECPVIVHESCIIKHIRTTKLQPPQCPWCRQPITDREILNKSKDPNTVIKKVAALGTIVFFAGATMAWNLYQQSHAG